MLLTFFGDLMIVGIITRFGVLLYQESTCLVLKNTEDKTHKYSAAGKIKLSQQKHWNRSTTVDFHWEELV